MVIHRLPVKLETGVSFREFQAELTEVGRIRLGVFDENKGKRGAPDKLETFRFTSQQELLIRKVAERYGGTPEEYQPQRSKRTEWQVITTAKMVPVYIEPQRIDPWLESWGSSQTSSRCVRRCDGITETKQDVPCLCAAGEIEEKDFCKPVARVQLLLAEVPGIGTWRLESHGANFVQEIAGLAPYVAALPFRVPGLLYLEERRAQPWVNGRQITTTVYVPHLSISVATPEQFAIGGDVLTRALEAGTPHALGAAEPARVLPVGGTGEGTDVAEAMTSGEGVGAGGSYGAYGPDVDPGLAAIAEAKRQTPDEVRATILRDIESRDTTGALDEVKAKLKARGVGDKQVREAWRARYDAIVAAAEVGGSAPGPTSVTAGNGEHQRALRGTVTAATEREARDVVDVVLVDEPPPLEPEYEIGDTVTVGGAEFTKTSEGPFPPATAGDDAVYDLEDEFNGVYAEAGKLGWPTARTNEAIREYAKVERVSQATAAQLHGLRTAMKRGEIR